MKEDDRNYGWERDLNGREKKAIKGFFMPFLEVRPL